MYHDVLRLMYQVNDNRKDTKMTTKYMKLRNECHEISDAIVGEIRASRPDSYTVWVIQEYVKDYFFGNAWFEMGDNSYASEELAQRIYDYLVNEHGKSADKVRIATREVKVIYR